MENRIYTKAELYAFLSELESAYRVHKMVSGEQLTWIDIDQYLIDQKALVRQEGNYGPAICNLHLFIALTDKWDQLRTMLNKKAYAKAKELEELATMG